MKKLFGTDGIRGVANSVPMTPEFALKIGQAVAYVFRRKCHRSKVAIGKDTRLSGYMIESAIASGITSMGVDVILIGTMTTPGIAFLTGNMDADCGIVISASHNPFEDNGIKIFSKDGFKLSNEKEEEIESLVLSDNFPRELSASYEIGKEYRAEYALGRYMVFLRHTFPKSLTLEGLKIVLDCANGATYKIAPILFKEMKAEVVAINVSPNGKNINLNAGSLYPDSLAEKVIKEKANVGFAFDGDGDRLIAVDEKGNIVTGDKFLAICAKRLKEEGKLKSNSVVSTVMSNVGLSQAFKKMQIKHIKTDVGDRYVLDEMIRNNAILGGEDSGHIIFLEHHTTGDGLITALQLLTIMIKEKKSLYELSKVMMTFPQVLINVNVRSKPDLKNIPEIAKAIKAVEKRLRNKGRVFVRYSGTQPLCRVMVEGPTKEIIEIAAKEIAEVVKKKLS